MFQTPIVRDTDCALWFIYQMGLIDACDDEIPMQSSPLGGLGDHACQ